jgi:hypothetical protein
MAGVGFHMGVMEAVEARCSITPEVIAFVSNKGPTDAKLAEAARNAGVTPAFLTKIEPVSAPCELVSASFPTRKPGKI